MYNRYGTGILLLFGFGDCALSFLDASLLTREVAEVEYACTAYFTDFVHFNLVNEGGLVRENPLNSDSVGDFTDGESLGVRGGAANLDHHAAEVLEPVLVTFFDPVGNGDGVTSLELRIGSGFVLRE